MLHVLCAVCVCLCVLCNTFVASPFELYDIQLLVTTLHVTIRYTTHSLHVTTHYTTHFNSLWQPCGLPGSNERLQALTTASR